MSQCQISKIGVGDTGIGISSHSESPGIGTVKVQIAPSLFLYGQKLNTYFKLVHDVCTDTLSYLFCLPGYNILISRPVGHYYRERVR